VEENKRNNGEDMSVSELVSRLKDNISSGSEVSEDKVIEKKADPDKDIASMLKKFMPEDESEGDFELEDVAPENEGADFELENDSEYELEIPAADNGDAFADEFEMDDVANESFAEDFEEPAKEVEDFLADDDIILMDALTFEVEEPQPEPKKKRGGLFGGKKGKSLADGYAEMLGLELDAKQSAEKIETSEQLSFDMEISGAEEPEESIPSYDELIENGEMLELEDINPVFADANTEKTEPEVIEEEPVPSQLFVLDNNAKEDEPEEEYFITEKNPLAFDDEDETPILPDESAFADVTPSDVSAFADEEYAEQTDESVISADGLEDKDINLMIALGYEEELEKAIGKDTVEEISDSLSAEDNDFIDIDSTYAFDGFEMESSDNFRAVGNKYKQEHSVMKMRLLCTGAFAAALFIFELLGAFGVTLGGALNIHHYPVVGIMLSLQLLVLACAPSWRQLLAGLYDAVTFTPTPNSIPSVAVLMTVIYDIIMALIAPNTGLWLYNFPAALCLVFLVLNDYFNLSREIRAFNTIATRRPKFAASIIDKCNDVSVEDEMMSVLSEEEQNEPYEKIIETRKAGFIENYFHRTNVRSMKDRRLSLLIFPFIALAIALGIVSFVTNKSGVTAFNISILTILFGMPMSAVFIYSYPFFSAVKSAFTKDATIIGESSVEEYADANAVIFSDKEIFPSEATVTKGIKLYDNNAIYYVLYHLTSLYSKIGGPLKDRLEQATTEMGHSEDVQIIRVAKKGIEAVIDGKVNLLAGQASFIEENGIYAPADPDDERMADEGTSVLYLVLDGVLSAKLYVDYAVDPEFEDVIADLAGERMETVIRTSDPNIDDELIANKVRVSRFPTRVIKCFAEDNMDVERADSGIVSRNSLSALARTISLCNKIRRVRKTSKTVSTVSMIVSVIMMIFLALFSSELGVASIYVALYQVFWMLPMLLFTKLYVK